MEDLAKLTQEEEEILELTAELWNKFLQLPIYHLMEANEMAMKIHDIQRMNARDVRSLASLGVLWACGICVFMVPLNTRSSKVVVLNGGNGYVKFNIQK